MIRKINLLDEEVYNKLGLVLNSKFNKLFKLEDLLINDYNKVFVYCVDGIVVGFVHGILSFDQMDVVNIVVDSDYRNRDIAKSLINYLAKEFNLVEINVEVDVNNDAVLFYKKIGFTVVRTIKNYYGNTDAYLMKKVF